MILPVISRNRRALGYLASLRCVFNSSENTNSDGFYRPDVSGNENAAKKKEPYNPLLRKKFSHDRKMLQQQSRQPDSPNELSIAAQFYYDSVPADIRKKWMKDSTKLNSNNPVSYPYQTFTRTNNPESYGYFDDEFDTEDIGKVNYGTPDPNAPGSNVPCGGCGSLLHCKDPGLPGYVPSEKFKAYKGRELRNTVCQRCLFLKKFKVALQVTVSPDEYPEMIKKIPKNGLILLVVDLTDFPCSIWPDIAKLIGLNKQVCIVGNKVDLLPKDDDLYLKSVANSLLKSVKEAGLVNKEGTNIRHLCLVSAKTYYGIEDLVDYLNDVWVNKGDIYIVGCTNTGKSSLFNALIQSDLCKLEATDLMQRATTSVWPGTTLNLLKFPIYKPTAWKKFIRKERKFWQIAENEKEKVIKDFLFQKERNTEYGTLTGKVSQTLSEEKELRIQGDASFTLKMNNIVEPTNFRPAFDPNHRKYSEATWCYDTPGSVHKEQLINMLTLDELVWTLPKDLIIPRVYVMSPGYALFVAGLGRIDYIEGGEFSLFTVFAAPKLPVSVVHLDEADAFYNKYLGTEVLKVPFGDENRLKSFPALISKTVQTNGIGLRQSSCDLVLSSAGWVSVASSTDTLCELKAYTPGGIGNYLRTPSMLPYAVRIRGDRIKGTPTYETRIA